jgi:nucleotide-binding universal stress UspA family protein
MRPICSILAATDFSPGSAEALTFAFDLARTLGARVTLFHAWQLPSYVFPDGSAYVMPPEELARLAAQIDAQLAAAARDAEKRTGGAVATRSATGRPADEIVRAARDGDYDLIVMGTHGRTGLKHLFLGSVAENVVRHADRPVITVRQGTRAALDESRPLQ